MGAVDRRHPPALEVLRDLFVGEDHQPLDQPVRLCLRNRPGADHVAARVELELRLGGLDLEARASSALAELCGQRPRDLERRGDPLERALAPGEDPVEPVVVEAGIGADPAAIEARRPHRGVGAELDLRGDRQPLDLGCEAAGARAEHVRKHRLDVAGDVGAVGPPRGLAIERRPRPHVGGDVGDVDPDPGSRPLALGRDGVVEIAGTGRIDGEGVERGQVATRRRDPLGLVRGAASFVLELWCESTPADLLPQQRLDGIAGVPRCPVAAGAAPPPPHLRAFSSSSASTSSARWSPSSGAVPGRSRAPTSGSIP